MGAPAHLARLIEHAEPLGNGAGSEAGSDSDGGSDNSGADAWRTHLPNGMQHGDAPRQNGLPDGLANGGRRRRGSPEANATGTRMAWLSPLLASNLGLSCHLQPFLQPANEAMASASADQLVAGGAAQQLGASAASPRRRLTSLDAVVIQAYVPGARQPLAGGAAAAQSSAATVDVPLPGGGHTPVPMAAALGISQVPEHHEPLSICFDCVCVTIVASGMQAGYVSALALPEELHDGM